MALPKTEFLKRKKSKVVSIKTAVALSMVVSIKTAVALSMVGLKSNPSNKDKAESSV